MNNRKGFTIIELLVVVGIIGLLASLAVVSFGSAQLRARDSKRVADMRAVVNAFNAVALTESTPALCRRDTGGAIVAIMPLSGTIICSVACGGAGCSEGGAADVTNKYINLKNLHDPGKELTPCADPAAAVCDYSVAIAPAASLANQSPDFEVNFWTEGSAVTGLNAGQAHTADEAGAQ